MEKLQEKLMDASVLEKCVDDVGGVFKFTVLLQKRVRELVKGMTPLVAVSENMTPIDIALKEFFEDKIDFITSEDKKKRKLKK